MEKYFSSIICSTGYCSTYNTIYKKDTSSKVYIIRDGDDIERATFLNKLTQNLRGYNITLFNPFYDECTDGIYIKNLNTYVLSDGGYNRISPILPEIWEKTIGITDEKKYPKDMICEVLMRKSKENNHYKNACKILNQASQIREKIHSSLSPYLDEDKIVSFIHRLCLREIKKTNEKGVGLVRFLSSPTPLGIHTHYETIFDSYENILSINDETGFAGAIIMGVIKGFATRESFETITSPSYFGKDFIQFLLFPSLSLAICISDNSHHLPFKPHHEINVARFFTDKSVLTSEKTKILLSAENSLLDKAVLNLYEGRDERFKYNNLVNIFSNVEKAEDTADKFAKRLLN